MSDFHFGDVLKHPLMGVWYMVIGPSDPYLRALVLADETTNWPSQSLPIWDIKRDGGWIIEPDDD